MADQPRQQSPFPNMTPVPKFTAEKSVAGQLVPKGPAGGKLNQAQLALQGLIGLK